LKFFRRKNGKRKIPHGFFKRLTKNPARKFSGKEKIEREISAARKKRQRNFSNKEKNKKEILTARKKQLEIF